MRSLLVLSLVTFGGLALWAGLAPAQVPPCDQNRVSCLGYNCSTANFAKLPAGGCLTEATERWKESCVVWEDNAGFRTTGSRGWREAPHRPLCPLVNENILTDRCGDLKIAVTENGGCNTIYAGCGGQRVQPC